MDATRYPTMTLVDFTSQWSLELAAYLAVNIQYSILHDPDCFEYGLDPSGHSGEQVRRIDVRMTTAAKRWVAQRPIPGADGGIFVSAEDSHEAFVFPRVEDPKPVFVVLDAVDGTTLAASMGSNWSAVVVVFVWSERRKGYVLASAAIACHTGVVFGYKSQAVRPPGHAYSIDAGHMFARQIDMVVPANALPGRDFIVDVDPRLEPLPAIDEAGLGKAEYALISAAAGPNRLKRVLTRWPGLLVNTTMRTLTAGTPAIMGAVYGQAGAIFDPEPAALRDAAHVLMLVGALGWRAYHADTGDQIAVTALFEEFATRSPNTKPIPPLVLTRVDDLTIVVNLPPGHPRSDLPRPDDGGIAV